MPKRQKIKVSNQGLIKVFTKKLKGGVSSSVRFSGGDWKWPISKSKKK